MKKAQKMSEAEQEVMRAVWASGGEVTSAALHERLSATREWKLNTVITFLTRLSDKGLIRTEKQGRGKAGRYFAAMSEEEYKCLETESFLEQVHGGSVRSLMTALAGQERMDAEELRALREWYESVVKEP